MLRRNDRIYEMDGFTCRYKKTDFGSVNYRVTVGVNYYWLHVD